MISWPGSSPDHNARSDSWYEHDDPMRRAKRGYSIAMITIEIDDREIRAALRRLRQRFSSWFLEI